jgi:hypothetical protein
MVRFFRGDTVRSLDASLMLRRAQDAAAIAAAWTSLLPAMPADALYLFEMTPMGLDESADAQYSAAGTGPPPALVGFLAAAKATGQAPVRVGESACQLASRRDCPLALYRLATAPPPRP